MSEKVVIGSAELWCADCRDVLPELRAHACVTDPPYGVDLGSTKGSGGAHGLALECAKGWGVSDYLNRCHFGDVRDVLRRMIADGVKVNCIVTSPPYWGLRSYLPTDHADKAMEIGSEPTLREFIATMTDVFMLAREVLADDGTCWINMGDSYSSNAGGYDPAGSPGLGAKRQAEVQRGDRTIQRTGLKPKDLMGQPWRLAFALQDAGWWLRQDIIWSKPNPMPESIRDRCTNAHEYIFLLSKSERYYFDSEAMKEPSVGANPHDVTGRTKQRGLADTFKRKGSKRAEAIPGQGVGTHREDRPESSYDLYTRNRRSVWTVATRPYKGAHFATFPPALIEPCILAGCPPGGTVLDIFLGSGTTAMVAERLGRKWIGIDIDERNDALQRERLRQTSLELAA